MNAHSPIWGSITTDRRGKVFEDTLHNSNLVCLKNGSNTHITLATNTLSAIDLTLTTPNISLDLTWKTEDDCHNSDHFPIIISFRTIKIAHTRRKNWVIDAADWQLFENKLDQNATARSIEQLTQQIIEAAKASIPETSNKPIKRQVPWWNNNIGKLIRRRKRLLRVFKRHPTIMNNIQFKKARAEARLAIEQAKKTSWQKYIESINNSTTAKDFFMHINRIRGVYSPPIVPIINDLYNQKDIANLLAKEFQDASSSLNYKPYFRKNLHYLEQTLSSIQNIMPDEMYNNIFTFNELELTLN